MSELRLFPVNEKPMSVTRVRDLWQVWEFGLLCHHCHFGRTHLKCDLLWVEVDMDDAIGRKDHPRSFVGHGEGTRGPSARNREGKGRSLCRCRWCRAAFARWCLARDARIITQEQYERHCLMTHCELCGIRLDNRIKGMSKTADHCHVRQVYRGTICHGCNQAIGHRQEISLERLFVALSKGGNVRARQLAAYVVSRHIDDDGNLISRTFGAWDDA